MTREEFEKLEEEEQWTILLSLMVKQLLTKFVAI